MSGTLYAVKAGDTLSELAAKYLGDMSKWPLIYEHNNRPSVVARTQTKIVNPDLIFVGQKLYIPTSGAPKPAGPAPAPSPVPRIARAAMSASTQAKGNGKGNGMGVARRKVRSIPFKYELSNLPAITVASPAHISTVKMSGSVTLQSKNAIDFVSVSQKGFAVQSKAKADHAFGKLVTGTKVGYNPLAKQISFEIGITSHSNVRYAPTASASVGISPTTRLPVAKASIKAPTIKGKILDFLYVAADLSIDIEVTPRPPSASRRPVPVRVPSAKPVPAPGPSGWDYLAGGALIAGAGVLIVATIAEDIITLGGGIADDVPSFAAAAAMFASGVVVFKKIEGGERIPIEGHGVPPNAI